MDLPPDEPRRPVDGEVDLEEEREHVVGRRRPPPFLGGEHEPEAPVGELDRHHLGEQRSGILDLAGAGRRVPPRRHERRDEGDRHQECGSGHRTGPGPGAGRRPLLLLTLARTHARRGRATDAIAVVGQQPGPGGHTGEERRLAELAEVGERGQPAARLHRCSHRSVERAPGDGGGEAGELVPGHFDHHHARVGRGVPGRPVPGGTPGGEGDGLRSKDLGGESAGARGQEPTLPRGSRAAGFEGEGPLSADHPIDQVEFGAGRGSSGESPNPLPDVHEELPGPDRRSRDGGKGGRPTRPVEVHTERRTIDVPPVAPTPGFDPEIEQFREQVAGTTEVGFDGGHAPAGEHRRRDEGIAADVLAAEFEPSGPGTHEQSGRVGLVHHQHQRRREVPGEQQRHPVHRRGVGLEAEMGRAAHDRVADGNQSLEFGPPPLGPGVTRAGEPRLDRDRGRGDLGHDAVGDHGVSVTRRVVERIGRVQGPAVDPEFVDELTEVDLDPVAEHAVLVLDPEERPTPGSGSERATQRATRVGGAGLEEGGHDRSLPVHSIPQWGHGVSSPRSSPQISHGSLLPFSTPCTELPFS